MKKFLCGVLCVLTGMSAMATEWPGWKCTDVQKLEAAKQSYFAENHFWPACNLEVLIALEKKAPQSFADIEAAVDAVQKPEKWPERTFENWKLTAKKEIPNGKGIFINEAWEFCKKNPSDYDFSYVCWHSKELGLNDDFIYHFMIDFIVKNQNSLVVPRALKIALDKSIDIDRATVKTDLQKMNTIFSRKLLKDKAKWEPIVAEIRTVLETY